MDLRARVICVGITVSSLQICLAFKGVTSISCLFFFFSSKLEAQVPCGYIAVREYTGNDNNPKRRTNIFPEHPI